MPRYSLLVSLCGVVLLLATAAPAQAQMTFGGGCLNGNTYGLYGLGYIPVPPYFALHPPVYYSHPVPRPYGYTPFALPPGVEPVEMLALPGPQEILNPFVEPAGGRRPAAEEPAANAGRVAQAVEILNPFVSYPSHSATLHAGQHVPASR